MDKKTYQDLARLYKEMYQVDEGAVGKAGSHGSDVTVGKTQGKSEGGGWTGTPQRGLGRNYKGDKDKVRDNYKKTLAQDKAKERGISPEARRERARKNKEDSAKKGIDNLLKDIRGK